MNTGSVYSRTCGFIEELCLIGIVWSLTHRWYVCVALFLLFIYLRHRGSKMGLRRYADGGSSTSILIDVLYLLGLIAVLVFIWTQWGVS